MGNIIENQNVQTLHMIKSFLQSNDLDLVQQKNAHIIYGFIEVQKPAT